MSSYREMLLNEYQTLASSEGIMTREAFFQTYCEKLVEADQIDEYAYLHFNGRGSKNRSIQIDGYSYNEYDSKLTLFIVPSLSYSEAQTLTLKEAEAFFRKAIHFFTEAKRIVSESEESSEGYGLAHSIAEGRMGVRILEVVILTDYVKSTAINVIKSTVENNVRIDYSIYDISRMQKIDESSNGKEIVVINLKEDFDIDGIPVLKGSETDDYQAYLCNIPGEIIAKMYDKYQSRLLEGNVRSFLQIKGKVNKGIRSTILNEPEMFFAYNNGITATAEEMEIEQTSGGLMIKSFKALQIVNGGQTTASLANALINDRNRNSLEQIKKIHVPMKISVVEPKVAEVIIPNISKYANSQNKVSDADLESNHPFHRKFEELSRQIIAPATSGSQHGTYWYYERANGQYRQETYKASDSTKKAFELQHPKVQLFKKVDLAKYFNIYLLKPHVASAGAQKSFVKFTEWLIKSWDKDSNFVNDEFYRKAVSLCILFKHADKIVRGAEWYDSYKANIVAYTLSAIFNRVEKDFPDHTIDFQQIWKIQSLSFPWVKQIEKVALIMYKHLIDEDRTVENVTEWAKRETCWIRAQEIEFEFEVDFVKEFISKKYVQTIEHSAKREQKEVNEMNALMEVVGYGTEFWNEVHVWGMREKIWNIQDEKFLKLALGINAGKVPSDKQAVKILGVLEKARAESFPK